MRHTEMLFKEWCLNGDTLHFALCVMKPFLFCICLSFILQIASNLCFMCIPHPPFHALLTADHSPLYSISPIEQYHKNSKYYSACILPPWTNTHCTSPSRCPSTKKASIRPCTNPPLPHLPTFTPHTPHSTVHQVPQKGDADICSPGHGWQTHAPHVQARVEVEVEVEVCMLQLQLEEKHSHCALVRLCYSSTCTQLFQKTVSMTPCASWQRS